MGWQTRPDGWHKRNGEEGDEVAHNHDDVELVELVVLSSLPVRHAFDLLSVDDAPDRWQSWEWKMHSLTH